MSVVKLAVSSGKRNIFLMASVHLSCLSRLFYNLNKSTWHILNVTHQGAAWFPSRVLRGRTSLVSVVVAGTRQTPADRMSVC